MRIIPKGIEFITFPVPDFDLEGEAYIRKRSDAEWRLICIPGTPCHTHMFKRLLQLAPDKFDVILINRLGYGKDHDEPVLDFNDQVKIIRPFLNDKRILLLGVSYGGGLSLTAALNYPENIEGVITSAALVREPHDYAKAVADLNIPEALTAMAPKKMQRVRAEIHGRRPQIGPLLDKLNQLEIPIEVLHGTLDTLVPKEDADVLIKAIGDNAHYKEIPGGTHYMEFQLPQQIFKAAERLIKRIESRV